MFSRAFRPRATLSVTLLFLLLLQPTAPLPGVASLVGDAPGAPAQTATASAAQQLLSYRAFLASPLAAEPLVGEAAASHALSVAWLAPFFSGGGYCSEATAFVMGSQPAALTGADASPFAGIDFSVSIVQHGDGMSTSYLFGLDSDTYATLQRLAARDVRDRRRVLSVCHSEPGAWSVSRALPARYSTSQCPMLDAAYRVGRTMFESDRLPSAWAERLNGMDEVWVPTAFMRDVCVAGGVDPDKLLVLPEPVDTDTFRPHPSADEVASLDAPPAPTRRSSNGAPAPATPPSSHVRTRRCAPGELPGASADCPFRFLSVGKWERRKGFDILLRAYLTAFSKSEVAPFVELYVLTSAYHSSGDFKAALDRMVRTEIACSSVVNDRAPPATRAVCVPLLPGAGSPLAQLPPVHLLTAIPQSALVGVYASVDCVVQASRGEGWGRPHVEAMAMALPLIATNWSGPTEFMTEDNAYPLRHGAELLPVPDGAFAGHLMAEPDALHLRELLAHVASRPAEARDKGRAARADMVRLYHPRKLAAFLNSHFVRIERLVLQRERDEALRREALEAGRQANVARAGLAASELRKRAETDARSAELRLQAARKEAAARVATALAELEQVERDELQLQQAQRALAAGRQQQQQQQAAAEAGVKVDASPGVTRAEAEARAQQRAQLLQQQAAAKQQAKQKAEPKTELATGADGSIINTVKSEFNGPGP